MGVIARQTIKTSFVYYMAAVIGIINRLFLLPQYLTATELGFLDIFFYVVTIFSSLSSLGSTAILLKYHQYFKNKNQYPAIVGEVILITLVGFFLLTFILFYLKSNILNFYKTDINDLELITNFFYLIPIFALIFIIKNLFSTFSVIAQRLTIPAIFNDFWVKISSLLLLLLISIKIIDFYGYFHLILLSYLLATSLLVSYCFKFLSFKASFNLSGITKAEHKESIKYSSFALLSGLAGSITLYADSIMLSSIEGFNISGIYSIAFFIGMSIELPKRALTSISQPIISSYFENKKFKEIDKLYKQSSINQGFIGFLFFLIILINIDSIFALIPNNETYIIGRNVALIIGVSKLLDMFLGVNNEILRASKHYYLDLYFLVFFIIITVGFNYILIPLYNIDGAAFATLMSILVYNIIRFIILKKIYNFFPFTFQSLKLLILFLTLAILGCWFPSFSNEKIIFAFINISIKSAIFTFIFVFISYKLEISPEINKLINLGLNKLRK